MSAENKSRRYESFAWILDLDADVGEAELHQHHFEHGENTLRLTANDLLSLAETLLRISCGDAAPYRSGLLDCLAARMLSYGERGLRQPCDRNFGWRVDGPDKAGHVWLVQQHGEETEISLIQLSPLQLPFLAAAMLDALSALLGDKPVTLTPTTAGAN